MKHRNINANRVNSYESELPSKTYVFILSLSLLGIPAIISVLCDLSLNLTLTWSAFVALGCLCSLFNVATPLVFSRIKDHNLVMVSFAADFVSVFILKTYGLLQTDFIFCAVLPIGLCLFIASHVGLRIIHLKRLNIKAKLLLNILLFALVFIPIDICMKKMPAVNTALLISVAVLLLFSAISSSIVCFFRNLCEN